MPKGLMDQVLEYVNPWAQSSYDPYDSQLNSEMPPQDMPEDVDVTPDDQQMRAERSEFAGVTIIRAEPQDMDEATAVADEIKHRLPVLLNLQSVPEEEAKRIKHFLGGVTYGLNGYMRRIAEWVYICSPFDMPVETLVLTGTNVSERESEEPFAIPDEY